MGVECGEDGEEGLLAVANSGGGKQEVQLLGARVIAYRAGVANVQLAPSPPVFARNRS